MRRRTVRWWNQVKEGWSLTATGRRKRPSLKEARCHWGKNSPQVNLPMLSPPSAASLVVSLAFTLADLNLLSYICRSISHTLYLCILMRHISLSTNVLLAQHSCSIHHVPPGSSSQMDLNGHTERPIRGPNSFVLPPGTNIVLTERLAEI